MVSEWDDVLNLPEDRTRVTVIIVTKWNVLCASSSVQESLDMFEEPRFVPVTNVVELTRLAAVHHGASHDHSMVTREHQALHKVSCVHTLHLLLECLDHLVEIVDRSVVQLDKSLARHNLNLHRDQEAEGAIAPGH